MIDALYANMDNFKSPLAEFKPTLKDFKAFIIKWIKSSLEILKTPEVALKKI
jgi:hypothetical protein